MLLHVIKFEAETEKSKAETQKTLAEKESIDLEILMKRNKIKQDSIERVTVEKNRKKIIRKRNAIRKSVYDRPINKVVINNTVILDRNEE